MREYTFPDTQAGETEAHIVRRSLIKSGFQVTLIGLDTSRNVFSFNTY